MGILRVAIMAVFAIFASAAHAADLEKTDITLGVGGKQLLYYLPLTIAERQGYFKSEGLNVTIVDFKGGSQSLQALVGGSADVVTGATSTRSGCRRRGRISAR